MPFKKFFITLSQSQPTRSEHYLLLIVIPLYVVYLSDEGKPGNQEERLNIRDEKESSYNSTNEGHGQTYLDVNDSSDMRRRSWGDKIKDEEKSGFHDRVSSSLDDLTSTESIRKIREPSRSRTQVINLPKHLTKEEESNKLADIIDSIKHSQDDTPNHAKVHKDASGRNANTVSMQGKSHSYSCLANLKLDDGKWEKYCSHTFNYP